MSVVSHIKDDKIDIMQIYAWFENPYSHPFMAMYTRDLIHACILSTHSYFVSLVDVIASNYEI
jgi:hypothetical protein